MNTPIEKLAAMGLHERSTMGLGGGYGSTSEMIYIRVPGGVLYISHFSESHSNDSSYGSSSSSSKASGQTFIPIPESLFVRGVDIP